MTATVTDLFCGAGGSSLGAEAAGMQLKMAANHWATAIDVHQSHFPEAGHDCADISAADPRRYPATDVLLASPECTNHSQARGVSRGAQQPGLFDAPDPAAVKSRATMWDVPRFAEQLRYDSIVVENVVEATKWVNWGSWSMAMEELGYERKILSFNSRHFGVAQSRDRIYVVFWRKGAPAPDLELEVSGFCSRCDRVGPARQAWKNGRTVGKFGTQWVWACTDCGTEATVATPGADTILDFDLPCPRIGDRKRPLAAKTRARILAGLERHGWVPVVTVGAGNGFERTPGNRSKPLGEPIPVQTTTACHALATPPDSILFNTAHQGRTREMTEPHPTVCASDDRWSLLKPGALLMRNNKGGAEMVTSVTEPARTMTTTQNQSLLLPYYGNTTARSVDAPMPTVTTKDRCALIDPEQVVDDCGFRMLEPQEISAAMAFPADYIPVELSKTDRVKLAGNAVTPPVQQWICGRVLQAFESA